MYQAIIDKQTFEITPVENSMLVNGKPIALDLASTGENEFHVIHNNKSFSAEVVKIDVIAKIVTVKINGKTINVQVRDKFDLLLEKMGMQNSAAGKLNSIKAPMPGLIIDLKVKEGDVVKQNDPLLILEAMKMENVIKAPGDGVVKQVKVSKGTSVEKNQVLIEF